MSFNPLLILKWSSVFFALLGDLNIHAASKKGKNFSEGHPEENVFRVPHPVRPIILKPVGTKPFLLPNGSTVDLSDELNSILNTAILSYPSFASLDPGFKDPCETYLELRSEVTNLEFNAQEVGIMFGYSPVGSIPIGPGPIGLAPVAAARLNVKIGIISIDFSIWKCVEGRCSAVAATTATHHSTGVNLGLDMNFALIRSGPNLVYLTSLGDIFRSIMMNGMKNLSNSARLNELPWQAKVKEVMSASGTLIFDAGTEERIGLNETFEVYAALDLSETGGCHVYETVAYAHTIQVNSVSSIAQIDQTMGSKSVQVGDVVMVRSSKDL